MIGIRILNTNSKTVASIYNVTVCYFSAQSSTRRPKPILSSAQYDDLINDSGRKRDFAAVRHLLSKRLSDGCLNTHKTFNFIATDVSVLDELLQNLAAIGDWYARKHSHDALVAKLAKLYRMAEAVRVAEAMVRKKYGATAATFHPIINALARKKEMSAAWRVVDAMREMNVRPDLTTFNYILTAYCFIGDVDSAADTLVKIEAEGMRADAITYDALVLGACRAGRVEGALAVMRRMVGDGVQALFSCHAHIIKEMVRCGYYAQAVEFVRIFAGRDQKLDAESFGFLVRCLKNVKRFTEADSVTQEMLAMGLPIGNELQNLSPNSYVEPNSHVEKIEE